MKLGPAASATWFALALGFRAALALADVPAPAPRTSDATPPAEAVPPSRPGQTALPTGPDRGRFAALWVTPLATHRFQGAGFEAGYRYGALAGLVREGFVQNDYAPVSGTPLLTLERTRRFSFDVEADAHWRAANAVALDVGGGLGLLDDTVNITSMNGLAWTSVSRSGRRIRPLLSATLVGPLLEASVTAYLGSDPEVRFALGVCWGRLNHP